MSVPVAHQEQMYVNVPNEGGQGGAPGAPAGDPPWLHGAIGRNEVDQLMRSNGYSEGLFLIRKSTRNLDDHVLSVMSSGKPLHFIIKNVGGTYRIDDGPQFRTLEQLVDHYRKPDDRLPTVLVNYCCAPQAVRTNSSYEQVWNAGHTAQAQISQSQPLLGQQSMLSQPVGQVANQMSNMSMSGGGGGDDSGAAFSYGAPLLPSSSAPKVMTEGAEPYAVSPMVGGSGGGATGSLRPGASMGMGGAASMGAGTSATLPTNREKFKELPRVKKWIDKGNAVANVDLKVKEETKKRVEGFSEDANERADRHLEQFSQAALAEEKMYLVWFNDHLEKLGKKVEDIGPALRKGVEVLEVMKMIGKVPPPFYAKRPTVMQQEVDNWHVVIKYMKKLGINISDPNADGDVTALDPQALHAGDRREMLKFFPKLLMYEAQNS